jgi:hypothetical protein
MRMPFRVLVVLAAGSLALPVLAQQGVAGRWNASVDTEFGPFAFVFEFIVDAAGKLTGAMHNELIGAAPIKDAVVNGNDVSFKLTFEGGPDGPMTISYTGTVKGDELALTSKFEGAPPGGGPAEQSFTAKRAQ